jgi:hypothetical protein
MLYAAGVPMEIARLLTQLREELENIDAAIASLERLHFGRKGSAKAPSRASKPSRPPAARPKAAVRSQK